MSDQRELEGDWCQAPGGIYTLQKKSSAKMAMDAVEEHAHLAGGHAR
jgi:hypothetical protein